MARAQETLAFPFRARLLYSALAATLLAAVSWAYLPTLGFMAEHWFGDGIRNWSHGPFVAFFALYLGWRKRRELVAGAPNLWGLPFVVGALALHGLSLKAGIPYLSGYSLLVLAGGLVALIYGLSGARRLLFPLLYALIAVPLPVNAWGVTPFLVQVQSETSTWLAGLLGASLLRDGSLVTVAGQTYHIVPLCSGFNFLMAQLSLILPALYLLPGSWARSLLVGTSAIPISLLTKSLLIAMVFVATPWWGADAAMSLYHVWLGYPAFALTFLFLLWLAWLSRHRELRT